MEILFKIEWIDGSVKWTVANGPDEAGRLEAELCNSLSVGAYTTWLFSASEFKRAERRKVVVAPHASQGAGS